MADRSRISFAADDQRLAQWPLPPFHVVSDTHFGHANLCRPDYENRPHDHDTLMELAWRERVADDDWIVHLGDVTFWRDERIFDIFQRLPGRKVMLWGNHDQRGAGWYRDLGFEVVTRAFELEYDGWRVLFSHRPDDERAFVRYPRRLNVHGHCHSHTRADRRLINCCVEVRDYAPQPVTDLLDSRIAELTGR